MASAPTGDGVEEVVEVVEEEEEEEEPASQSGALCPMCSSLICEDCKNRVSQPQVNVGTAGEVIVVKDQKIFVDRSCRSSESGPLLASMLKTTPTGNVVMDYAKTLTIVQQQTIVVQGQNVQVNLPEDDNQLEDASDGALLMKAEWPGRLSEETEILITQIVHRTADAFFRQILNRLSQQVPEHVIQTLFEKFRLRLLGLTKDLRILLEVEAEKLKGMLDSCGEDLKGELKEALRHELQRLLPVEELAQITWRDFSHLPVQCSGQPEDSEERHVSQEVQEVTKETVTGALTLACEYGNPLTCERLLQYEAADVNAWNRDGKSPVHIACAFGQVVLLDILLKAGAELVAADRSGRLPLHHACGPEQVDQTRRLQTVQWLLAHGATMHGETLSGQTALELAKMGGHQMTVDFLQTQ
ncbi:uncharacterized protein LOC143278062 [Babylonia areolata]|uniref:uncharacterized protein LOC143278062 n=1 Tax=Babylonia areolata TaxID=304850 RepID=UPI003FD3653F